MKYLYLLLCCAFFMSAKATMTNYDVKFYKLDLIVNSDSNYINGTVTIDAKAIAAMNGFEIELDNNMTVSSVRLNSASINFSHTNNLISIALNIPKDVLFSIEIDYKGKPQTQNPSFAGCINGKGENIKSTYTVSEPDFSKSWWPCKQVLNDKADSVYVFLTCPSTDSTISNGKKTATYDLGNGKKRHEWKHLHSINYYNISFAVGTYKYEKILFAHPIGRSDSVKIQILLPSENYYLNNKTAIDQTDDLLEYFSEKFGEYPYADEKYGMVYVPGKFGGLENQTVSVMCNFNYELIAHELIHQWFGNCVSGNSWQDIFVHEGFGRYGEYLGLEKNPTMGSKIDWLTNTFGKAMELPYADKKNSIFIPPQDVEFWRIFNNQLSYDKGAALLHMIRYEVGDQLFFETLKDYIKTYKGSNASGKDFKNSLEKISGTNFNSFFTAWHDGEGIPSFTLKYFQLNDNLNILLEQNTNSSTALFKMHIPIRINYSGGYSDIKLYQSSTKQYYKIPQKNVIQSITIDPDNWILNGFSSASSSTFSAPNFLNLPNEITICKGKTFDPQIPSFSSYKWYINDTLLFSDRAVIFTKNGKYILETTDASNILQRDTINVIIADVPTIINLTSEACGNYSWRGKNYLSSGTYYDTIQNSKACDSIFILKLTITQPIIVNKTESACSKYLWRDKNYTKSGTYSDTLKNTNACDSIFILDLSISDPIFTTENTIICGNYLWRKKNLNTSGEYSDTLKNLNGCDSIFILKLTISQPIIVNKAESACSKYLWRGKNYTKSGTYSDTLKNANACDSIFILDLSISEPVFTTENALSCGNYLWRKKNLNTSGEYSDTLKILNACDSIFILKLTISQPIIVNKTETACSKYLWRGKNYTKSGTYSDTLKNANACDSIFRLNLSISEPVFTNESIMSCGNYLWRKKNLNTSGEYSDTVKNINACDSIFKLKLMIHNYNYSNETIAACDSYKWRGKIYNSSGQYNDTVKTKNNCDSIFTLNLEIHQKTTLQIASNQNNATCGNANGSATIAVTGGKQPYSYFWSNGAKTKTATNLSADTYYIEVVDAGNCKDSIKIMIGNINGPSISSISSIPPNCASSCNGNITIKLVGGKAPYTYLWNNKNLQTANYSKACHGLNIIEVIDANKCSVKAWTYLNSESVNPELRGNLYLIDEKKDTLSIQGEVNIYAISENAAYQNIASVATNQGNYEIIDLAPGKYIIAANPFNNTPPFALKTYLNDKNKWNESDTIIITCGERKKIDLKVRNQANLNGKGIIKGNFFEHIDQKRTLKPIDSALVMLEQYPNKIISQTLTDQNGEYSFDNVPNGTYKLFIDIPGSKMSKTHIIEINETDTAFMNKDFYTDSSANINILEVTSSINNQANNTYTVVYPNPYSKTTHIKFVLKQSEFVELEIFNFTGNRVALLENKTMPSGKYTYEFGAKTYDKAPGIYFVKLTIGNQIQTFKIVEQE